MIRASFSTRRPTSSTARGATTDRFPAAQTYETANGVAAKGGGLNGPGVTVAGGMVFVSSGYGSIGFMPGNVLLAFSVDGR